MSRAEIGGNNELLGRDALVTDGAHSLTTVMVFNCLGIDSKRVRALNDKLNKRVALTGNPLQITR